MKNKFINIVLIIILIFFFTHFLKDVTQDILKIKTPLDYLGNVNEDLSLFNPFIKNLFNITAYLSFIGEFFLIITIPIYLFCNKKNYLLKYIWIIIASILMYFLVAIFLDPKFNIYLNNKNHCSNPHAKKYLIENKNYCLLTASNQEQWQKGLMFYKNKKELKGADGMIFIFPEKQIRSFWNKNTYLDLDVYWIDENKVIGKSFLPSIEKSKETITVKSPKSVNKVIELPVKN